MTRPRLEQIDLHHVRVTPDTVWSFLKLQFSDGTAGWGEATVVSNHRLLDPLLAMARTRWVGQPLCGIRRHLLTAGVPASMAQAAIQSAIEHATVDAEGRMTGRSAAEILDPDMASGRVKVYANINRRTTDRSPAGFAASAKLAVCDGYAAIKVAPLDGVTAATSCGPGRHALIDGALERLEAIRQAVGPDTGLYVDCHWRLNPLAAEQLCLALSEFGVEWYECPLPEIAENMPAIARLRKIANERGMRLAGLESLVHPDQFEPWLRAGCYDVVMPDVKYAGGMEGTIAVSRSAARHGVACAPHNPTGPVCHVASIAAALAGESVEGIEHQYDETPHFAALVNDALPVTSSGCVPRPAGPGLGIVMNEALIDRLSAD